MSTPLEDTPAPRMAWSMYKRMAIAAIVIVLSTTAAVATAALLEVKDDITRISQGGKIAGIDKVLAPVSAGGPQTILLLGSDRRFADIKAKIPARSDTMILMRLDPDSGKTSIMNIPRDLKVQIPKYGTQKINAAYEIGGAALSAKIVGNMLASAAPDGTFPINHVVNINFGGFQRAINRLGCVYTDVDHHYYNDNTGPGPGYAAIDIQGGYQRLCGSDALNYVRYRHLDNDLVRAARQQDFLRQAKDQIGVGKLISDRKELLSIVGAYTQTDIRSTDALLRLLKLAAESAKNPLQEVHFDADQDGDYLSITPENLKRDVGLFLGSQSSPGGRGRVTKTANDRKRERKQKRSSNSTGNGLIKDVKTPVNTGIEMGAKLPFSVYYPGMAAVGSSYQLSQTRSYDIDGRDGKPHYKAYRYVVSAPGLGQYYGIQGTNWTDPPILDNPSETRTVNKRKLQLYFDGDRLRLVAWKTSTAVYWVSNTLLQSLTNKQMLGIAGSLRQVGT